MRFVDYGALELKQCYQKNMAIGIAMAGLVVIIAMSSFLIYNLTVNPPHQKGVAIGVVAADLVVILAFGIFLVFRSISAHPRKKKKISTIITIAVALIFVLLGAFVIYNIAAFQTEIVAPMIHIKTISELGAPPSISKTKTPAMAVASPKVAPPKVGIPKAVPDEEAPVEQEFATQKDLSAIQSLSASDLIGDGTGDLVIDIPAGEYLPAPEDFVPYDEPPKFVKKVKPKYPKLADMSRVTGTVWVQVLVDKHGKVRDVRIYKDSGTHAGLEEAAIEAAKVSEFTPAISNNQPLAVWIIYRYDFKL